MNIYERKYTTEAKLYLDKDKGKVVSTCRSAFFSWGQDADAPFMFQTEPHATVRKLEDYEIVTLVLQGIIKLL